MCMNYYMNIVIHSKNVFSSEWLASPALFFLTSWPRAEQIRNRKYGRSVQSLHDDTVRKTAARHDGSL